MTGSDQGWAASAPDLGDATGIVVVRANALGDYLLAEPALAALRAAAPRARITLIGAPWHAEALAGRPGPIDEVVVAPWVHGVRTAADPALYDAGATAAFLEQMRQRRFDLALQLHGGGRFSNPFTQQLGATITAGLRAEDAPPLDRWVRYEYWQHEVARYLEVVALVGAAPVRIVPRFEVTAADRQQAQEVLREAGVLPEAPVAVVHPGASDPRRRWPAEGFAAVCDTLTTQGAQVVVVGSREERDLVRAVTARAAVATPLHGRLDIGGLAGLLSMAAVLVGNDSGPRHLADAVGTPTVSVYWCGNVINAGPLRRDTNRVHISWTGTCPECGVPCVGDPLPEGCAHQVSFVAEVPTTGVCQSVRAVYAGRDR